jgi:hypothetical protein
MDAVSLRIPNLFVAFACDTEDNHPNYVPGWEKFGSNYEINPALIKWNWTKYWRDLSECFAKKGAPVTWLIRVDDGPVYDSMLTLSKNMILTLKSMGDEIGIHIHTWIWNEVSSKWIQTTKTSDEINIVTRSLKTFNKNLGFAPFSSRMGWTAMSNAIMNTLNSNGLLADASATPGTISSGKFGNRDNIYDWSRTPSAIYHPNIKDYQTSGNMSILEMPISTIGSNKESVFGKIVNTLSGKKALFKLVGLSKWLRLTPHNSFYITPWWSSYVYTKIIREYERRARKEGDSFLIGTFHPCDILDPKTGDKNFVFEKYISKVLDELCSLKDVNVSFTTLSNMANKIDEKISPTLSPVPK